jgi:hypothetical protein
LKCFQSILSSERIIYSLVSSRDFIQGNSKQKEERTTIRDIVIRQDFLDTLKKSISILLPIDRLVVKYQSDSVPISEILVDFGDLIQDFTQLHDSEQISDTEKDYLRRLCKQRYEFMYGDSHGLSYLLDPRYIGERLSIEKRKDLENLLFAFPLSDSDPQQQESMIKIYQQYTQFVISAQAEKQTQSFRFDMLLRKVKTPLQYWQTDGIVWPELQSVCLRLFSLATSTASCERNFSAHGFVHSKLRNSLSQQKVEKLVYIRNNFTQFHDSAFYQKVDIASDDDESDL